MNKEFLDRLFIKARSHNSWKQKDVDEQILRDLYDLVKNCPTSANSEPMRIVFLKSRKSKDRAKPFLNVILVLYLSGKILKAVQKRYK